MAKRRTSGIQRRERASEQALNQRLDASAGLTLPDWRLLLIGGVLLVGVITIALVLLLGSTPNPALGSTQPDDGQAHIADGTIFPPGERPYSSTPATSGPHWNAPNNWGVYTTPQREEQLIHNLEHGGIIIWYEPDQLDADAVAELARYVNAQTATGISGRFKFILTPWDGPDFGHPIAVTAWRQLLYLDEVDTGTIDDFARSHYGRAPEPGGGPGPP
jgi:hypothetical protein